MSKKKQATPAKPKEGLFTFTPYIEIIQEQVAKDKQFLDDINNGTMVLMPELFGEMTIEGVFNKVKKAGMFRERILRNWERWVEMTAPVSDNSEGRTIVNVDEGKWAVESHKELTKHTGIWRDILELRGCYLQGDAERIKSLISVYMTVMTAYTYACGFKGWDEFGIVPHDNAREKFGAGVTDVDGWKVIIIK